METHKVCSFFGHRKINHSLQLEKTLALTIENLIIKENVKTFLFGSKSEFDKLCLKIVTNLKDKYPFIKRVSYSCKSESAILEKEKDDLEKTLNVLLKRTVNLLCVDEEFEYKNKYVTGKSSYIQRNIAMINDSNFCVFYYDINYKPNTSKNSGTKIAYNYAVKSNKQVINIKD